MAERPIEVVNLGAKFRLFDDAWRPRVVAELNDAYVKVVKLRGEFLWHRHDAEDELFFVVQGSLTIRLRDRDLHLKPGELVVIPRGVEHLPVAQDEAQVVLIGGSRPRSRPRSGWSRVPPSPCRAGHPSRALLPDRPGAGPQGHGDRPICPATPAASLRDRPAREPAEGNRPPTGPIAAGPRPWRPGPRSARTAPWRVTSRRPA